MISLEGMTEEQEKELQELIDKTNAESFARMEKIKPFTPVKPAISRGAARNIRWLIYNFVEGIQKEMKGLRMQ